MRKNITIGDKVYQLQFDDFDEEMDIDNLLRIDHSNLVGEMVTFPIFVNRFGNLLAEAESKVAEVKLNLEITEAKLKERLKAELQEVNGGKNPTVDALNNAVLLDKTYQAMRKKHIEVQKNRDYIQSVFWSAKDKSSKLDKLSLTLQQGDVTESEIEGRVNGVLIKQKKGLIK
jgi:hypothetical protein